MKKALIIFGAIVFILVLSSCMASREINEQDIKNYIEDDYLQNGNEIITDISIFKRDTDKATKLDRIWFTVTSDDSEIRYTRKYYIEAGFYSDNGWMIDYIESIDVGDWNQIPLSGTNLQNVKASLKNIAIPVSGEDWTVGESSPEISIIGQQTNLNSNIDNVSAQITLDSGVMQAKGVLDLKYSFNGERWVLDQVSQKSAFTSSYKEGFKPNYTDQSLINLLTKQSIEFGDESKEQYILIKQNEISSFKQLSTSHSDRGKNYLINCSFTLTKLSATFDVDAQIVYNFKNSQWSIKSVNLKPEVKSINLTGDWVGNYFNTSGEMNLTLSITRQGEDGSLSANFIFSPKPTTLNGKSGSYKMEGGIDYDDLHIVLKGIEWIDRPGNWIMLDLDGLLFVEENYLKSISGYKFTVSR